MTALTNSQIDPARFGRVAVLMGGVSAEREVSLNSGAAVLAAAQRSGVNAHGVDVTEENIGSLNLLDVDRVFIALHGKHGEDGAVQGMLELLGMPYTGSGVLGSSLGMDKVRTKQLWESLDLPTPPCLVNTELFDASQIAEQLGYPVIAKPVCEGSSIGVTKIESAEDFEGAYRDAQKFDAHVMFEKYIQGREFTAAILGGEVLPLIELSTPNKIYDYAAKYELDSTRYLCPAPVTDIDSLKWSQMCATAFDVIGGTGWGRVDFMVDESGAPWLLEINTSPGMTDHSLVPMAAAAAGLSFDQLVLRILETTL